MKIEPLRPTTLAKAGGIVNAEPAQKKVLTSAETG